MGWAGGKLLRKMPWTQHFVENLDDLQAKIKFNGQNRLVDEGSGGQ